MAAPPERSVDAAAPSDSLSYTFDAVAPSNSHAVAPSNSHAVAPSNSLWGSLDAVVQAVTQWSFMGLTVDMTHRFILLFSVFLLVVFLARKVYINWSSSIATEGKTRSPFTKLRGIIRVLGQLRSSPNAHDVDKVPKKPGSTFAARFKARSSQLQRKYERLDDVEAGKATPVNRPMCDMLLMWYEDEDNDVEYHEDGMPQALPRKDRKTWRSDCLELIAHRLFVKHVKEHEFPPSLCGGPARTLHIKLLSTKPFHASAEDTLKEKRVHRLLCRLATRDGMPKRLVENKWTEEQRWKGSSPPVPKPAKGQPRAHYHRQMLPFDESLQPHLDPCGHDGLGVEHLVFKPAAKKEWLTRDVQTTDANRQLHEREGLLPRDANGGSLDTTVQRKLPELFTSMERIHLMRLVLEWPIEEGGCGINLEKAEHKKWFEVVPLHDGLRTKTNRLPDQPAEEQELLPLQPPTSLAAKPTQAALPTGIDGTTRDRVAPKEVVGRIRRLTESAQGGVRWVREASQSLVQAGRLKLERLRGLWKERLRGERAFWEANINFYTKYSEGTLIRKWFKQELTIWPQQPLDKIRDYFGTEVALYFAFIEFVVGWMLVPGVVGLVPMFGWVWYDSMDNWVTSIYSVFALVWFFFFTKMWTQRNRELVYYWNTEDAKESQSIRFQFEEFDRSHDANADVHRSEVKGFYSKDDLFVETGPPRSTDRLSEPSFAFGREKRGVRVMLVWLLIGLYMLCSSCVLLFILSFRAFLMTAAWHLPPGWWGSERNWLTRLLYRRRLNVGNYIAVLFSAGWTMTSNLIGKKVIAERLTTFENHRTQLDHDTALLYKKFAIMCLNSYAPLLYIGFLKATPAGELLGFVFPWLETLLPWLDSHEVIQLERDYCHDLSNFTRSADEILAANGGANPHCMEELSSFLTSTMAITAMLTVAGITIRIFVHMRRTAGLAKELPAGSAAGSQDAVERFFYERQARLEPWKGAIDDCLELVIEIGFVVLFAPAFPIAAFVIWLVNLFKQRADAYRMLKLTRRPLPRKVAQLFGLEKMLQIMGFGGLLTNTGLLYFTATQLTDLLQQLPRLGIPVLSGIHVTEGWNHFAFFVLTEHLLLLAYFAVMACNLDDKVEVAKFRAWSKHFEPQWIRKARTKAYPPANDIGFDDVGPFRVIPVPENAYRKVMFAHKDSRWTIDRQKSDWLLGPVVQGRIKHMQHEPPSDGVKAQSSAEASPAAEAEPHCEHRLRIAQHDCHVGSCAPLSGRLSNWHSLTLTKKAKEEADLPLTARWFAWCYPLACFADHDGSDAALRLDLELELHDAVNDPERSFANYKDQERFKLLHFLAVGGYMYTDKHGEIMMLATLARGKPGLRFGGPMKSENHVVVKHVGQCLSERREFSRPTLQSLRDRGVVGFCWIPPSEAFSGLAKRITPTEYRSSMVGRGPAAASVQPAEPRCQPSQSVIMELEWERQQYQDDLREHEDDEKAAAMLAKKYWPSGAFIYKFDGDNYRLFHVVGTENLQGAIDKMNSRINFVEERARRVIAKYGAVYIQLKRLQQQATTAKTTRNLLRDVSRA